MKLVHMFAVGAGMFHQGKSTLSEFKEERKDDLVNNFFNDECAEACFHTKSCREDKNTQGTYCKRYGRNRKSMRTIG